jgi:hypothetical protein
MNARGSAPALLISVAMLTGQAQSVDSAKKTGTIDGVVVNSATHAPVKKAVVVLRDQRQSGLIVPFTYSTVSDATGHFHFNAVEAGQSYILRANAEGFMNSWERPDRSSIPEPTVTVGEDQHLVGISLSLEPFRVISGKVLDVNGDPLYSFFIDVMRVDLQRDGAHLYEVSSATTDDHGAYRIFNLPPGRYLLRIMPPNFDHGRGIWRWEQPELGYVPEFYPRGAYLSRADLIDVTTAMRKEGIEIRLRRAVLHHVRGRAVYANSNHGVASQGGLIAYTAGIEPQLAPLVPFTTSADGSFDVRLPSGEFRICCSNGLAREKLVVADRDLDDVTITLLLRASLFGTWAIESIPPGPAPAGLRVSLDNLMTHESADIHLGADGKLVFPRLPAVEYRVEVSTPRGLYLKSIRYGDKDAADGRLDLSDTGLALNLVFAADCGQLNIHLQSPTGSPRGSRAAVIAPAEEQFAMRFDLVRTSQNMESIDGHEDRLFAPGLAPGSYKVIAFEGLTQEEGRLADGLLRSPQFRKLFDRQAASVAISSGGRETVDVKTVPAEAYRAAEARIR